MQVRYGANKRKRFKVVDAARGETLRALARVIVEKDMPSDLAEATLAQAGTCSESALKELKTLVAKYTREGGKLTTFEQIGTSWTSGDLHRRWPDHVHLKRTAEDDALRLAKHIYPVIGNVPLKLITLDHAEQVMRRLDPALKPATRRQVAQLLGRVMALAVYPAREIDHSPIPKGWLPKAGARKAYAILYPSEDAQLLACRDIPLKYRIVFGFAHREMMRRGELEALLWSDIDLKHGTVKTDTNKTSNRRFWKLAPGVAHALECWRKLQPKGAKQVFPDIRWGHLSERVREALTQAGIDRPELFERSDAREHFGAHSFRRSGVTRSLALGKGEDYVRQRTGHVSTELLRYRQAASALAELELGDVLPLDQAIPEFGGGSPAQDPGTTKKADGETSAQFPSDSNYVREKGVEPSRLTAPEPKSGASANSATRARDRDHSRRD